MRSAFESYGLTFFVSIWVKVHQLVKTSRILTFSTRGDVEYGFAHAHERTHVKRTYVNATRNSRNPIVSCTASYKCQTTSKNSLEY